MRGLPNTIGEHPAEAANRIANKITVKVFKRTGVNIPLENTHDVFFDIRTGEAPERANNYFEWYARTAGGRHGIRVEVGGQLDTLEHFLSEGKRNGICFG